MKDVRCPHCGNTEISNEANYYACKACSTMFHTVEKDGEIHTELD